MDAKTNQDHVRGKAPSQFSSFLGAVCAGIIVFIGAYGVRYIEAQADSLVDQVHAEQRVKDVAATLSTLMSVRCNLTSSLSLYPLHGDDIEGLLKKADATMYITKEQGENGFCTAEE